MPGWLVDDLGPRAPGDQIRAFLDRYGETEFRHASELVPILRRDDPEESHTGARDIELNEGLRRTYRLRARRLHGRPVGPSFPPDLASDVRAFSEQLDAARDQCARWWSVRQPSGITFWFVELVDHGRIAGAIKSADQRIVDPDRNSDLLAGGR